MVRAMEEKDIQPAGERKPVPPFQSPLWDHWELIKSMRRKRKMWKEIAEVLEKEHGLKTSHKTIQNFVKRALRIRKEGRLPFGWEDTQPTDAQAAQSVPAGPAQPAAPATPPKNNPPAGGVPEGPAN